MEPRHFVTAAIICLISGPALAGRFRDYPGRFSVVYADYRAALTDTGAGRQQASLTAVSAFERGLRSLGADYTNNPPPPYANDPRWPQTMGKLTTLVARAKAEIAAGDMVSAHGMLEDARRQLDELHPRDGIVTFSDRMDAYRAQMQTVVNTDTSNLRPADIGMLREKAAVLHYLAVDLLSSPPPEAAGNVRWSKLSRAFGESTDRLLNATRWARPRLIRSAVSDLKKPYTRLFLNFG